MATQQEHKKQAEHNQAFLDSIDADGFPDWYATAAFYKALHLVEVLLRKKGKRSNNHVRRNRILRADYVAVWRDYKTLYSFSRLARYRCMPVSTEDIFFIEQRLRRVESTVAKMIK